MSESVVFSKLGSIKECPICGGELEKGYLAAPRGVYWGAEKHGLGVAVADYMMPRVSSFFTLENLPGLRCEKCGIAILDFRPVGVTPKTFLKKCVSCGKEIPIASEECPHCETKQPEHVKP